MRFAKFDRELTKAAKFKDRRSKIGRRADGTLLVRLAGKDMQNLRDKAFELYQEDGITMCWDHTFSWQTNTCKGPLELSHDKPRGQGGSDVIENVRPRCRYHHRLRDLHGQDGHF